MTKNVPPSATMRQIYGVIGIIRLIAGAWDWLLNTCQYVTVFFHVLACSGPYLIVVTGRERIGTIGTHDVWKVTAIDTIAFARSTRHLSEIQIQHNQVYVRMVQTVFQTVGFYYSSTYDLTHTLQRLENSTPGFKLMPLYERADQRFIWNKHLLQDFISQPELTHFALPIMHGCILQSHYPLVC
jgi:hypothetical protein